MNERTSAQFKCKHCFMVVPCVPQSRWIGAAGVIALAVTFANTTQTKTQHTMTKSSHSMSGIQYLANEISWILHIWIMRVFGHFTWSTCIPQISTCCQIDLTGCVVNGQTFHTCNLWSIPFWIIGYRPFVRPS